MTTERHTMTKNTQSCLKDTPNYLSETQTTTRRNNHKETRKDMQTNTNNYKNGQNNHKETKTTTRRCTMHNDYKVTKKTRNFPKDTQNYLKETSSKRHKKLQKDTKPP